MLIWAQEIKLRAERRMGEMLKETDITVKLGADGAKCRLNTVRELWEAITALLIAHHHHDIREPLKMPTTKTASTHSAMLTLLSG